MNKANLTIAGVVVLLIAIGVNAYFGITAFNRATDAVQAVRKTTRQSAKTRITTVEQRCELTKLLAYSLPVPSAKPKLLLSYEGCVEQLAHVKYIAEHAP